MFRAIVASFSTASKSYLYLKAIRHFTASWCSPQKYLINCQAYANFKSQICDWERLTVFSQQLPQESWILENSSRPLTEFFSFNTEAAQDFCDEVDIKEAKSFGWSKSMRCEAQIARFWLLRRRVSQSLLALPKPVSTRVENACKMDELKDSQISVRINNGFCIFRHLSSKYRYETVNPNKVIT